MTANMLKRCPFCKSNRVYGRMTAYRDCQQYAIMCDDCGMIVLFDNDDDRSIADVINRYNRRL